MPKTIDRPLIAIVGSLDESRQSHDPPLHQADDGRAACVIIGRVLAEAGCDLLVFSGDPRFVERDIVRGYAEASGGAGRVVAHPPRHGTVAFDLPADSAVQVVVQPDTSDEWELPYYRALMVADGLVLVGGSRSTRIAGIVALMQQVPVLPVAAFGGGAGQVWVNLDKERNDAIAEEIARMGQPWSDDSAAALVEGLLSQRERRIRRQEEGARALSRRAAVKRTALVVTLAALAVTWLGVAFFDTTNPSSVWSLALLLAVPMIASVAAAMLRNVGRSEQWGWAAARGLAAGFVTVFLYIAGELISVPDLLDRLEPQRLLFFLAPLGFTAGYTFDRVLERVLSGQKQVPAADPERK